MTMILKIFFSYFSFVAFFAYSASLFQNNLLQQVVSSAAPALKEEATKSIGNLPSLIPTPSNLPTLNNTPTIPNSTNNTPQIVSKPSTTTSAVTSNSPILSDSSKTQNSPQKSTQPSPDKRKPKKIKNAPSIYKKYSGFVLTLPEGETYFQNIQKTTRSFSSKDTLSSFKAASSTSFDSNILDAAVVCFQKVKQGYFRVHSLNPYINGLVTDEHDKSLLRRIFQLNKYDKFNFFIRVGADNTGDIRVFNGLIFSKFGKGNERGDSVCFARYNVEKIQSKK